jgi:hypothetical protein
LNLVLQRV